MQHNRSAGDQRPPGLIEPGRPAQQITTVQLATSIFCTFIGSLMLVAPHQFSGPIWSALEALLIWVGALFLLAGLALVGCVILGAPRRWVVVCHLVAAAALVAFVYNAASIGLWPGASLYALLAVGVALAPFVT